MSDVNGHNELSGDDLLAAEYVIGVLDRSQRRAAEKRRSRDPSFAALVAAWETRLTPWTSEIAPVRPSPDVWSRIEAGLPRGTWEMPEWWANLAFWRGLTAGAGAVAFASIVALFVVLKGPAPAPLFANIEASGRASFVATVDGKHATVAVVPAGYAADAARVPELWLIGGDGKPRSLGLLDPAKAVVLVIPANLRAAAAEQAVLAVSLEPPGGSKTGAPTGPVIAQGKLTNL